jgi:predicted ATP-grasp superfamily ATP-dependent carboligase
MRMPTRILVLDGHTNQALAVVRSLGRAGHVVFVASAWLRCLASWSRHCAGSVRIEGDTLPAFDTLRAWARAHGVEVVLPLGERSCLLCALARDAWLHAGISVGCAPLEVLTRAFDKGETLHYADAAGVRAPITIAPASLEEARAAAARVGFPCVIKPRFSHAWTGDGFLPDLGCAYAASAADLDRAVLSRRQGGDLWPLVQAYVPGRGKGVFALCDHGRALAWFAHERLRDVRPSGSGSSLRRSIQLAPHLRAPAERLLAAMSWHGPAMVEFREPSSSAEEAAADAAAAAAATTAAGAAAAAVAAENAGAAAAAAEEPWLMEVNGRFWSSLQLAIEAGVDFPALWLAVLRGEDVSAPPAYREGVTVRWLWGDVKRFLHVLAGPPRGFSQPYPSIWQGARELLGRQAYRSHLEIWQRTDPWPAVGEWVQGARELWHARSVR